MKASTTFLAATLAAIASAHYTFDVLVVDGVESSPDQFIRRNARAERYMPTKFINSFDGVTPLTDDFRCNLGAADGSGTQIAEVAPGTQLAMKLAFGATMAHPGPAQVFMSLAPGGSVQSYAGDGDWFKIHQEAVCNDAPMTEGAWCTWDQDRISFEIPAGTPPGEYLVRAEHVGLHGAHAGEAEFYYACAQVRVTGNGNGVPGPMVKIPGMYSSEDESWNFGIYGNNRDFPIPAPAVWSGGSAAVDAPTEEAPVEEAPVEESPVEEICTGRRRARRTRATARLASRK